MQYISLILISSSVVLETIADIVVKKWSIDNKLSVLSLGLALYFVGTILWAYSLKFNYVSKAITIFTILNLIAVIIVGVLYFNEHLSFINKIGIIVGIFSVILLNL